MGKKKGKGSKKGGDDYELPKELITLPPCEYSPSGEFLGPCTVPKKPAPDPTDLDSTSQSGESSELDSSSISTELSEYDKSLSELLLEPTVDYNLPPSERNQPDCSEKERKKKEKKKKKPKKEPKRPIDREKLKKCYLKKRLKESKAQGGPGMEKVKKRYKKVLAKKNKYLYKKCKKATKQKKKKDDYKQMILTLKRARRMNDPMTKKEHNILRKYEREEERDVLNNLTIFCRSVGKIIPIPPCDHKIYRVPDEEPSTCVPPSDEEIKSSESDVSAPNISVFKRPISDDEPCGRKIKIKGIEIKDK